MKKIIHITTVHPAFDVRIFYKQCKSIAKLGYDTYLLANIDEDQCSEGVNIVSLGKAKNRLHRMTGYLWKTYKKALSLNGDIYHFHDPELIPLGLLLKLKRKKVVYDVHEDVPRDILLKPWLPKMSRKICSVVFEIMENFSAKFFDAIVTVTPLLAARFTKENNTTVEIRNYPISQDIQPIINQPKKQQLCYAGLISRERGIFEMLKTSFRCEVELNLAGRFNSEDLYNEVVNLTEWNNVNYLGYLDRNSIVNLYQSSQIGLAVLHSGPTFNDSLPIKLFEYMAAGLPVIASNFPLWREIIDKHDCGICVDPKNLDEICEAIYFLLNNAEEAQKMGERGQNAIRQFYTWDTEEEKLSQVYARILT